jgi:hypothetical protein
MRIDQFCAAAAPSCSDQPDAVAGNPARHGRELSNGLVLKPAVKYQRIDKTKGVPRDNH